MCRPVSSRCLHHNLKHSIDQANLVDESRIECREIADHSVSFSPVSLCFMGLLFQAASWGPSCPSITRSSQLPLPR